AELQFTGQHAFSAEKLRAQLPLKPGDVANTQRIRSGLSALRALYAAAGFLDILPVPRSMLQADPPPVTLSVEVTEGQQYHMGKLRILAARDHKDRAETLSMRWSLEEGTVFDAGYPNRFLEENKDLLPEGFRERDSLEVVRNCRDGTVTVLIALDRQTP